MPLKPDSLEALHGPAERMFNLIQQATGVHGHIRLDLRTVDIPAEDLTDPRMIAAFVLRRLQALRHLSDRHTATSVVVLTGTLQELFTGILSVLQRGTLDDRSTREVELFLDQLDGVFREASALDPDPDSTHPDVILFGSLQPDGFN